MRKTDKNNVIISDDVVINNTLHKVRGYYVVCNSELNQRAWNTTEQQGICHKCFPDRIQLALF